MEVAWPLDSIVGGPAWPLAFWVTTGRWLHLPAIDEGPQGLHEWLDERSSMKLQCFNSTKLALCLRVTSIKHPVNMQEFKTSSQDGLGAGPETGSARCWPSLTTAWEGRADIAALTNFKVAHQSLWVAVLSSRDRTFQQGYHSGQFFFFGMMFCKELRRHEIKPFVHQLL